MGRKIHRRLAVMMCFPVGTARQNGGCDAESHFTRRCPPGNMSTVSANTRGTEFQYHIEGQVKELMESYLDAE